MIPFLAGFLIAVSATPVVIAAARRWGWIAVPRADRWHSRPTALMGGIAIFAGTMVAWACCGDVRQILPIAGPAAFMFLVGLIDDRVRLRPHVKMIAQIAAAVALMAAGITFARVPPVIALPLTLLWIIGITNAVNLLDNMDGLAAGVALLSALAMAACFVVTGAPFCADNTLALAGACAGFLVYNFNPAKVFMGDCGSMFIGFSLAALSVQGMHRSAPGLLFSLLMPVMILAIPIFDTTLVSVARTLHGRSVSEGGRDHSSHRLVSLGLSERSTVLVLYALTLVFGMFAVLATQLPLLDGLVLAVLLFIAMVLLGVYLGLVKVYPGENRTPSDVRLIGGILLHKKQVLQVSLDIPLIIVAFVGAQLLRFEGALPSSTYHAMLNALPLVLVVKLGAMAFLGGYQGMWRYAGVSDVLLAAAGSTLGSLVSVIVLYLMMSLTGLSKTALIVDWALFTLLAAGVRVGYVGLQQVFSMIPAPNAPRVLILGAGLETPSLIDRLRDPLSPTRAEVVGILDDDPDKLGRTLNGVSILGALSSLRGMVKAEEIHCCLLGVSPESHMGHTIRSFCEDARVAICPEADLVMLAPLPGAEAAVPQVPAESVAA